MAKFNVGDKVICIKDYTHFTQGKVYKIQNIVGKIITLLDNDIEQNDWYVEDFNKHFEIVPTKNQRITALENEVAELRPLKQEVADLKLIVHELRGRQDIDFSPLTEPSTINTVEDIIEFEGQQYRKVEREAHDGDVIVFYESSHPQITDGKPYKVFKGENIEENKLSHIADSGTEYPVDGQYVGGYYVYELIKPKPLTPNQQRAAIIEKAKKFVETNTFYNGRAMAGIGVKLKGDMVCIPEFIVNDTKRTVVVLFKWVSNARRIQSRGIAKCDPSDVFNEHIGKAIALGRALGLDVSEFEQAVQPTFAIGQIVYETEDKTYRTIAESGIYSEESMLTAIDSRSAKELSVIINDTNAIYEVSSNE